MENQELIAEILENQNLTQEQIADIMAEISEIDNGVIDPTTAIPPPGVGLAVLENELRMKLDTEVDWRMKAKIAARIISLGLE